MVRLVYNMSGNVVLLGLYFGLHYKSGFILTNNCVARLRRALRRKYD